MGSSLYRWHLRRGSRKEVCPQCGRKRFVPYVSAADGHTIITDETGAMAFGRCDREQSCGYHAKPAKTPTDIQPVKIEPKRGAPMRFASSVIRPSVASNLPIWLLNYFSPERVREAVNAYRVGATDDGWTIFWQIDEGGHIHAGKAIPYGEDGHRMKTGRAPARFLHKDARYKSAVVGEELEQCLFGQHLLTDGAKVAIVESEKTAIFCSLFFRGRVWLACGGSQMLKNADRLQCLKGHDVWLVPDHGQYYNWRQTAMKYGFQISPLLETSAPFDGADILDYITTNYQYLKR